MDYRRCLVLHKSQWDNLKKQAGPLKSKEEAAQFNNKIAYYKSLDEQSKEWKKNWPDTVEGCIAKVEARKKQENERNIAFVKAFQEQVRNRVSDRTKIIAEAKLKIFNTSNYGQQLISAVRESKLIEEREAQIELKKIIKQKEIEYDEAMRVQIADGMISEMAKRDDEAIRKGKKVDNEQAEFNKMMHEYYEKEKAKAKEEEKLGELEDARLQKMNLEIEKHEMDHCKERAIEQAKQYEEDCRAVKEEKRRRGLEENELIALWAKYHDIVRCKEKKTLEKDQGESSENYKRAYEIAAKSLENNKKTYETFVIKGIEKLEKSQAEAEENEKNKNKLKDEEYRQQLHEDYRTALEVKSILKHRNKCCCDKQSLFTKPCGNNVKKVIGGDEGDTRPESFLAPYTKLSDELNKRKNLPTPWTAAHGEHKYFAEQAASAIGECKYKHMARKVVYNYKKSYNYGSTTALILEL